MILLNKYFRKPVFWDYFIIVLVLSLLFIYRNYHVFSIPSKEILFSVASDITNVCFTSAGFIITLVAILITFKSTSRVTKTSDVDQNTVFELFFASNLYFETARHFKNCIKSLVFVAVLGYLIKLFAISCKLDFLFYYNLGSIIIVSLTLWRCLLIFTKIINMQKEK